MDEYLSDDLAEDSDDDKKIRQAQARASRKRRQASCYPSKRTRFQSDTANSAV